MNKLVKTVKRVELVRSFLNSLNGVLNLTDRELDLLETMVKVQLGFEQDPTADTNIIGTINRKYFMNTLGVRPDNLSRYIAKFKQSGILVKSRVIGEYVVNSALIPELIGDRVQITIILKTGRNNED